MLKTVKKKIVNSLINNCNVRLKPSTVCSGVGVFSIIPIEKDTVIFEDVNPDKTYIKWSDLINVDKRVLDYLNTMCNSDENGIFLSRTVNNINISYFVNHSQNPNIKHDLEKDVYVAIRNIEPDEELLCTYTENEIIDF